MSALQDMQDMNSINQLRERETDRQTLTEIDSGGDVGSGLNCRKQEQNLSHLLFIPSFKHKARHMTKLL